MSRLLTIATAALVFSAPRAAAHEAPVSAAAKAAYAPYEWLIGDWISNNGGTVVRQSLTWGPHRAYVRYTTFMAIAGKPEIIHFDGIAVWNGKSKGLDYVFAVEPGSTVQEKGTIHANADGSLVREVEFTGADGETGQFRQTFRKTGPDSAVSSLMRQTAAGWEPTFPGSDRLLMKRSQ